MADGPQANPKEIRKKALVRHRSACTALCCRATSSWRASRSTLGMKKLFTIAILASSVLPVVQGSLFNLKFMVEALTGKQALWDFVGYGCYCGFGGRGLPMDGVDWCCHAHDCCYEKLFDLGCHPYIDPYEHSIENNTVVCSELNKTECDKQTCECDKNITLCFLNQMYNETYRNYLNVYCQGPTPNCSIYEPTTEDIAYGRASPAPLVPL